MTEVAEVRFLRTGLMETAFPSDCRRATGCLCSSTNTDILLCRGSERGVQIQYYRQGQIRRLLNIHLSRHFSQKSIKNYNPVPTNYVTSSVCSAVNNFLLGGAGLPP